MGVLSLPVVLIAYVSIKKSCGAAKNGLVVPHSFLLPGSVPREAFGSHRARVAIVGSIRFPNPPP
jgi:hypothetical protein